MGRKLIPTEIKLEKYKSINENGCWEWTGSVNKRTGYGKIRVYKKWCSPHRVSYELFKGKIPEGFTIDHLCKNRKCMNPSHLEAVTMRENILRGNSDPAINARKEYCLRGHLLAGDNLYFRKDRLQRTCRKCSNMRSNRWIQKKRDN